MIDRKVIDEINEKTDIVGLVSEYVKLEKAGKNYKGLCPFHSDTNPSFSVSPERNFAKCFSCNEGGGPIRFYQKINNVPFMEAVYELGKRLNINIDYDATKAPDLEEHFALKEAAQFYHYYLLNSEKGLQAQKVLEKRGITLDDIKTFHIGLAPDEKQSVYQLLTQKDYTTTELESAGLISVKNNHITDVFSGRIMFPIIDHLGRVVGFSGRSMGNQQPKYYNSPESIVFKKAEVLYNLHNAIPEIRKHGKVVIHEGFFDCIASHKAGITYSVASMGTALSEAHVSLLGTYTKQVIVAYDGDNPGIEAAIKTFPLFMKHRFRIDCLWIKENLDPDDYYKNYGKDKYLALYKNLLDHYAFIYETSKHKLNLSNQNDQQTLKMIVRDFLSSAPNTTKDYYLETLSKDLKVSKSSLQSLLFVKAAPKPIQPKPKRHQFKTKYYRAEMMLLVEMFKNSDNAKKIEHALGIRYVVDVDMVKLRSLYMIKYLPKYDTFNETLFTQLIEEESAELLDAFRRVQKLLVYPKAEPLDDHEINNLIQAVKLINEEKIYQELLAQIRQENEAYRKTILLEQLRDKRITIDHIK